MLMMIREEDDMCSKFTMVWYLELKRNWISCGSIYCFDSWLHNNLDDKLLQDIQLGSNLGDSSSIRVIHDSDDVWIIRAASGDEISFIIETNSENFQSIYVKRKLIRTESIVDCLDLKSDEVNWYGGPEQMDQRYPIQKFEFHDYAYITKELESAAIMERYWLSSRGFFILIDSQAPLFIDQNGEKSKGRICFTGKKVLPYDIYLDEFEFNYRIGLGSDAREAHLNVVTNFLGKPRATPDERLIQYPIWNTWVRHGKALILKILFSHYHTIKMIETWNFHPNVDLYMFIYNRSFNQREHNLEFCWRDTEQRFQL